MIRAFGFVFANESEVDSTLESLENALLEKKDLEKSIQLFKSEAGADKASLLERLDTCGKLAFSLQEKNAELNALLEKNTGVPSALEIELTTKYPHRQQWYSARQLPYADGKSQEVFIDVRDYLATFVDDQLSVLGGSSDDEKALRALQWVLKNVSYVSDKANEGFEEFWQFPFETIQRKKGDCDDFAILTAALALKAGVPYYRLRVCAGWVQDPNNANGKVGHLYLTYARETDNKFVVLDGTYFVDGSTLPKDRVLHRDDQRYLEVWYSFDLRFVYSYKNESEAKRLESGENGSGSNSFDPFGWSRWWSSLGGKRIP